MITEWDIYIQKFYRTSLFGNESDPIAAASKRAYRDFCRTIDFKEKTDHSKAVEAVTSVIRTRLKRLSDIQSKEGYDKWHEELTEAIQGSFGDASLTVGQVQKWINMTMKYLIVLKELPENEIRAYLHVPIDSIILKKSRHADFFLSKKTEESKTWSQIEDYKQYMRFQNTLREELREKHKIPIEWEFEAWTGVETHSKQSAKKEIKYETYRYYKGEAQKPENLDSTSADFWYGESMYDKLQNKDYYTQEAENWRKELEKENPGCRILNYNNETLGIILYIDCLFGKFCPYGSSNWIYEY